MKALKCNNCTSYQAAERFISEVLEDSKGQVVDFQIVDDDLFSYSFKISGRKSTYHVEMDDDGWLVY